MEESFPRRILVVRLGAIGDVTNALVFATAVKDARPGTEIGWVVHELARPLVEGHPAVDQVHPWARSGGVGEVLRLVGELRRARYDLAVDLQRLQKSALLARLSGAPRVLGYDRARAKEGSWIWTKERLASPPAGEHMVQQYLEFARHLGIDRPVARHLFPADTEAETWAEGLLGELGSAPILVNLGATKPANRWESERFGHLALACREAFDAPVCLTGSEADREVERRALAVTGRADGVRSLVGTTRLPELVALAGRARLFLGCDTGPMHVAAARGTPVVALFGPADPRRTGPYDPTGTEHRVVRVPPPCAPCNRRTCNQARHACMEDITVELVVEAARSLLCRYETASSPEACGPRTSESSPPQGVRGYGADGEGA